MHNLLQQRL